MNNLSLLASIVGGAVTGFVIGSLWKANQIISQRRVQQELWDHKFRLAETDREAAVAALNQSNIDVKRIKATFEDHTRTISELKVQLRSGSGVVKELEQQDRLARDLQEQLQKIDTELSPYQSESKRKSLGHEEVSGERDHLADDLAGTRSRVKGLKDKLSHEGERLREWEEKYAALQESKATMIEGLEERTRTLGPFPEWLEVANARVAEWEHRYQESERNLREESDDLLRKIEDLDALPRELRASREQLEAANSELQELRVRSAHVDPLQQRLSERDEELVSVSSDLALLGSHSQTGFGVKFDTSISANRAIEFVTTLSTALRASGGLVFLGIPAESSRP